MKNDHSQILDIQTFRDLPVNKQKRHCTDVLCLIIGLVFSIALITVATVLYKKSTFYSLTLPTDSDGKICGVDLPNYPYLFFPSAPLIQVRVCVSTCPTSGATTLNCSPNSLVKTCAVSPLSPLTDTIAQQTNYGDFCWPINKLTKKATETAAKLTPRQHFFQSIPSIWSTLMATLVFSIIFLFLVHRWGQLVGYSIIPVALVMLVFAINLVKGMVTKEPSLQNVVFIGMIVLTVLLFLSIFKNCYSVRLFGVFLKTARTAVAWRWSTLFYILVYMVFLVLFIALVAFEFLGFWSNGRKIFLPKEYIYYRLYGFQFSTEVAILLVIQLIWGISFLKESFNFCLNGNGIAWYFEESNMQLPGCCSPLATQITKHLGSVIACSFMTAFFPIFDYLYDMVKPVSEQGCYTSCFSCLCGWFRYFGSLIRSDGLVLVNLTSNSYWQSSRYCQYLNRRAPLTQYFQFSSRVFSLASHSFIVSLAIVFAIYIPKINSMYAMVLIIVGSMVISTFFISFHADMGQSIEILFLMDQEYLIKDRQSFRLSSEGQGVSTYRSDLAIEIQAIFFEEDIPLN